MKLNNKLTFVNKKLTIPSINCLSFFLTKFGNIKSYEDSGLTRKEFHHLTKQIKMARNYKLVPYVIKYEL